MKTLAVIISPNYKDYAKKYLADCVASLKIQTFQDFDLFLIDNESTDESYRLLKELAPGATIIINHENIGFAGGNNSALRKVMNSNYQLVFLLNMDTIVDANCFEEIIKITEARPNFGAIQARLMLHPQTNLVNSLGNATHFLGFGYSRGYQETYVLSDDKNETIPEITYPSGAAVLLKVEALRKIGLFDEEMWMYNEDQDLGWRFWLAGYPCFLSSRAVVYHKYEFNRSIQKYYWMDRNRIITILKNYHLLTLILIFPAFIIMEIGLLFFSLQSGWFKEKIKVWVYFFSIKNWRYILRARRYIQADRKITDREITSMITGKIWYQEIGSWKLKLINPIFNLYWKIVRLLIFW